MKQRKREAGRREKLSTHNTIKTLTYFSEVMFEFGCVRLSTHNTIKTLTYFLEVMFEFGCVHIRATLLC